ncbi:MAG: DUF3866 family protein [Actinomycetota bacterium]|nr:DUF3866 family protein [Actinomycetota bacterium]
MALFHEGKVVAVVEVTPERVRAKVALGDREIDAVGYPSMLQGELAEGDAVVVNVTGLELGLGTGGIGLILWNLDGGGGTVGEGHIMKMRYTPWQMNVVAAEAPESPHHEALRDADDLGGLPVVACGLHSQIPAVAAGIRAAAPAARVGYLMTDGGALPAAFSNLVTQMKEAGLVDSTCTTGHAFGGDLEAVNVFSGLVALQRATRCDAVIAAMGPGVVGTGSRLGHSAIEQGQLLDAATALHGRAIATVRVSFHDGRPRHFGISHHTLTALTVAARERCTVVVPKLPVAQTRLMEAQLEKSEVCARHELVFASGRPGVRLLRERGINPVSMGRTMGEAPELWYAAAAAGSVAGEALADGG